MTTVNERQWDVLLLAGASGTGKTQLANVLGAYYHINVMGLDDLVHALKALTKHETLPLLHQWQDDEEWQAQSVKTNVDWLFAVSREIAPAIKAIVNEHLREGVPLIIEGDFMDAALVNAFEGERVKMLLVHETDEQQIAANYLQREGGKPQPYRAQISAAYAQRLFDIAKERAIPVIQARPWNTALDRTLACL